MDKSVSALEANRNFSRVLREVRDGQSYIVTNHGRPVAHISPVSSLAGRSDVQHRALIDRLRTAPVQDAGAWTRDELYER